MRLKDKELYEDIKLRLKNYQIRNLPGISSESSLNCLSWQIVDSIKRVKYVTVIRDRQHSDECTNPSSNAFDPIKAAAFYRQQENYNEAFWLVFLATHFGKHKRTKWQLVKDVYSGLSEQVRWDWNTIVSNVDEFRQWLAENIEILRDRGKVGNHRKYTSLSAYSNSGTGAAIATYVHWIGADYDHRAFIEGFITDDITPKKLFRALFNSMDEVKSFGRMAKFDYLTMLGKLGLVDIEPDSTYMVGATGPYAGSVLLFGHQANRNTIDAWLAELEEYLGLDFGMQILEDAICNWQKKPYEYQYFGG